MKKRSALMVSAGLVLTLVVGGLAVAIGTTGPTVSNGTPRVSGSAEPLVRTVRRTVTVQKKADQKAGEVVQMAAASATSTPSPSGSDDSSSDDSGYEDYSQGPESESSETESHEDESNEDESHGDGSGSEDE